MELETVKTVRKIIISENRANFVPSDENFTTHLTLTHIKKA